MPVNDDNDPRIDDVPSDEDLLSLRVDWDRLGDLAEALEFALGNGLDPDEATRWLENGFTVDEFELFAPDGVDMELAALWIRIVDDSAVELADLRHLWMRGVHPFDPAVHHELERWNDILDGTGDAGW